MFKKKNATISGVILLLLSSVFMPTIVLAETNIDPIVKSSEIQEEGMSLEKIEESKLHNEEPDENITEEISSEEDEIIDSKNDDINKQDTNKQDNQIDTQKVEDNSQSNKKEDQTSVPEQEKSSLEDEEKEINAEEEVFSLEKNREKAMEMMEEDLQARNEAGMQRTRAVPYTTAFINSVANAAVQNGKTYGLYPSVIIAQSILESGWGKSKLSGPPNNNLFGIKAEKGYKGPYVAVSTKEWVKDSHYEAGGYYITIIANFRKYSSYNETFKDHAEFLKHKRYTNVWIENADTYKDATAALQKAGYATDPQYASKLNSIIKNYNLTQYDPKPSVSYTTHVQSKGTLSCVADGVTSGTIGKAKRVEAIKAKVDHFPGLGIEYASHVQSLGWQDWQKDGALSGTEGKEKRIEAVKIKLTGNKAKDYDVYYRVHVQTYGWLGWAKNGDISGTTGLAKRIEAIEIKIVLKGEKAPGSTERTYIKAVEKELPSVMYSAHVQSYGWMSEVKNGELAGTEGKNKRLEAIKIRPNETSNLTIRYSTHVQTRGWLDWVSNGELSGTEGQQKRLEAVKIKLDGKDANLYDIYYRAHIQSYGWLDWAKNGDEAGTQGLAKRLEAIQVKIIKKGSTPPGITTQPFIEKK